ncbi:MAG: DUF4398 domain-containing protein [Mariprofundus sp.]|nr:DUF4398 domain-containing protein [Mariprofundus sp.]
MRSVFCLIILLLSACATKPPVQAMSDARSAIKTAQQLPGDMPKAAYYLKSAEQALSEAAQAVKAERYEQARVKAREARRNAQQAARIKQSTFNK